MAEVAVMAALGLLPLITPQLIEKLNLQMDVEGEIESMQSWRTLMQAFMEEYYGHQHRKTLADVLRKVGEIAFDIEDVFDEFNRLSLLHKFYDTIVLRDIYQRGLKEKIRSIKEGIKTITIQKAFAANSMSSSTSMPVGNPLLLLLKKEMVGYEDHKRKFITSLVHGEKRPVFLAVDGPPGSGKTTFVANVLNEERIKKKFDALAIVSSARFDDGRSLLQKVCESMKVHDEDELRGFLNGKRYLIVVDDVWGHDEWKSLKDSIFSVSGSSSRRRSRIIVTTRSSKVSAICDHVTSLQGLETPDAEKLFFRKAFPGHQEKCPPDLHDVSRGIAKSCGGFPLAIVTVAGALANKQKNRYEWERFHKNFGSEIWTNSDLGAINDSLLPSYMDLSSRLKCCFLYMSIFPENRPVERGRLIRLWVAERFAVATDTHTDTAEEVAEDYLNQLIQRNLILVSNSDLLCLPKIIHSFVVRKSKEENFASVFSQTHTTIEDQRRRRRLSFHDHCRLLSPKEGDFDTVRSMFLFRSIEEETDTDLKENLHILKLIKILDVQGGNVTKFYKKITRLVLLRYLSFRDTKIESIPSSIHKLSHLETLDLRRTQVAELPGEISDLYNLRHLLASKYDVASDSVEGVELPAGISRLTNLQTLSRVKVDPSGGVLKELKELTQLKELGLTHLRMEHGKDLCAALELMKSLTTLDITSSSNDEFIEIEEMESHPKSLKFLYLNGRLEKIPAWMSELDGAVRIDLKGSGLMNIPLQALNGLRNLRELHLLGCFSGEELRFEGEGLEKLEIIVIEDLGNLTRLKVGGGAAPELKKISVRRCPRLKMPFRVGNLVEFETAEDIDGGDNYVNKWVNRARAFVPDRINVSIDMKLRGINRRR